MSRREFTTAPPRNVADDGASIAVKSTDVFDPLRYCIFTTLALVAWVAGPEIVVAATSAIGVAAYWRARRAGLTRSRCILGDTRFVILYLVVAFAAGGIGIGERILAHLRP